MRLRTTAVLPAAALALASTAAGIAFLSGCGESSPAAGSTPAAAIRQAAAGAPPPCFPNCRGATLNDYPLEGADLRGGDFTQVRWHGARLRGANLSGANLSSADFSPRITGYWHGSDNPYDDEPRPTPTPELPSDLSHANLNRANLTGTNFRGANLDPTGVAGAKWSNTTCPNGSVTNTGC
ncbi:MAG: pentapeptide repeat-containing protein [Acidobacteria bacterium]|nr:pentapeptide repeat-containing protein [Acidobacteriota bacterium]